MSETNEEVVITPEGGEGEGAEPETITVPKKDYDKLNQDFGSLKRDYKDLKKSSEKPKEETPTTNQDNALVQKLEKMALRQAGITHPEDIELAQKIAKKWNMDIDDVLADDDFKAKLERQQTGRTNVEATSNVKGSGNGASQAKSTPEYWLAKGQPPTPADVPDATLRRKIVREFLKKSQGNGKMEFYNN